MPRPLRAAAVGALDSVLKLKREVKPGLKRLRLKAHATLGKHYCPVCDNRVARFEPIPSFIAEEVRLHGFKYTPDEAEMCNARHYACPHCGAVDRDRLYALYLQEYFRELSAGGAKKFVDFAPTRSLSDYVKKLIAASPQTFSYVTADLFREDVDDRVDIMDMKIYGDSSVDFFICSHILEHVADDRKALAELYRFLKPGGRGVLVVPIVLTLTEIDEDPSVTDAAERWRRFGQDDHVRLYSKEGFLSRVRQAGFTVHQLGQSHFGASTFKQYGITDQSVMYVVEKR